MRDVEIILPMTINIIVGANPDGHPEIDKIDWAAIDIKGKVLSIDFTLFLGVLEEEYNDELLSLINDTDQREISEAQRDAALNVIMDTARRLRNG